jgi:outer membrane immunogenic protein
MTMNFRSTVIGLAVCAGALLPLKGQAGDLPGSRNGTYAAPMMANPAYGVNWAGFYAGLNAGYGFGQAKGTNTTGGLGGIQIGANYQSGQLVFGGEFDADYTGIDYRAVSDKFRQKWLVSARGRFGYSFDRFLPYVTAGLAVSPSQYTNSLGKAENTHVGFVFGVGGEAMVTDRISVRAEWLHYRFSTENYAIRGVPHDTEVYTNALRVGVNYKF